VKPLRFHPDVQRDINRAMAYYGAISESIADEFWTEVNEAFRRIERNPRGHHFDSEGLRRFNLERFPFNVLDLEKPDRIRVQVVRHNSRHPTYGRKRRKE
jgi:hypothetical protein